MDNFEREVRHDVYRASTAEVGEVGLHSAGRMARGCRRSWPRAGEHGRRSRVKYRTIVADPPWQTTAGPLRVGVGEGWQFRPGMGASQPLAYATMSVQQI